MVLPEYPWETPDIVGLTRNKIRRKGHSLQDQGKDVGKDDRD